MSLPAKTVLLAALIAVGSLAQSDSPPVSTVPSGTLLPAPGTPFNSGSPSAAIAAGDFNKDGFSDLVVAATTGQLTALTILLGAPDGELVRTFRSPILIPGAAFSNNALAVADFNGDGKLDIAFLGEKILVILLGNGQGAFSGASLQPLSLFGFDNADTIGFGDFNHDNKLDLAIADLDSAGPVAILLGDGMGGFMGAPGSPPRLGNTAQVLTVADFNMDGYLDVALTNTGSVNEVSVLFGDGTGQLSVDPKGPFATGTVPTAIAQGDFNGDGKVDLAVVNWAALTITILLGDGTGGFTRTADLELPASLHPAWIAAGDLDGDGILDLAVTVALPPGNGLLVFLGDGKGGFQISASGVIELPGPGHIALADFNLDGRLDVATANADGTISVLVGSQATASIELRASNPIVGVPFLVTVSTNSSGFRKPTGTVIVQDGSTVVGTVDLNDGSATSLITLSTAGTHSLTAAYQGDLRTNASSSPALTLNVGKGSQTISFPALPSHAFGDPPFAVSVSSSSGLPVTITVLSGPATVTNNVLTLTGAGIVTLQASQIGDANYLPATAVEQTILIAAPQLRINAVRNAASYSAGPFGPGSLVVMFGTSLTLVSNIEISDASGKLRNTAPYFSSPGQINFILPADLQAGNATLTVQTESGSSATAAISIGSTGPGLFTADASGKGVAAGSALRVSASGEQTVLPMVSCAGQPPVCTAVAINLGAASDSTYLTLYGTGIRGRSSVANVTATVGGIATNVLYAGSQAVFPGLDQVNLPLNPALRGHGSVDVILTVDGVAANVVTVAIQ